MKYDRAVVEAAVHAAPIFAARGWEYRRSGMEAFTPDAQHLMDTVQRLVNQMRELDITLDEEGFGEAWGGSGRWRVGRVITPYTSDTSDDEIHIHLEMGELQTQEDDQ